ncbi:translocation/assembly module TamB domain-containing protein [Jannaschia aquimarina]|uniref:TamB protein n=1 Tax=Jannaschia aquimarina TaxID=935700 RepID=A0A0D1ECF7_9RHOB|nr:translocation/assembly module TamB domain-containing protein [Jannaschia aquimarina]KIT15404.1 Translocation and assembly module TamB [Jannaschia aquimarina]SNT22790.1 autotransporter secretion inner membrane protein TamB [Jannaschia aquimarina]
MAAFRRLPSAALLALTVALPAAAQEDDRDPGFLAGLIEDNLSAPGLSVQIDGFEGALSSEASVEELRIADDAGTWLVLQDVVLDWNRSALLRGRLEVEELTAALIRLERAPLPAEGIEPPPAAAEGFSLPDLPVAVDIERLAAQRIELGEELLGEAVALTLEASAQLVDGTGRATLSAERIDGPQGVYSVDIAYGGAGEPLTVDLDIVEAEGGLASTQLGLPGAPAIELTVDGEGPLDAFSADITLASDGQPRLTGSVTLEGQPDGRRFEVDLGGDVTELFAPRYRAFFGEDVGLVAEGLLREGGGTDLDTFRIDTRALRIQGTARLGADGWPEFLDVDGALASATGEPILLPTTARTTLGGADLSLSYDPNVSDDWSLSVTVNDLERPDLTLAGAQITADGRILRADGTVRSATGALRAALSQIAFADPDLARAVGSDLELRTDIGWQQDAPVTLDDIALVGNGYALRGDVDIATGTEGLPVGLDLAATIEDLARLSGLAGADLAGRTEVTLDGSYDPVAATFDLSLGGEASGLATGIAQLDGLLTGRTTLATQARRTDQGTFLDRLDLSNPQLSLTGSAAIFGEAAQEEDGRRGEAAFEARIPDGTAIDPRLDGEIALVADLSQGAGGLWSGTVDGIAPGGTTISASGVLTGDAPDIEFSASVADLTTYADGVPGGASLAGRAFARGGIWSVEADASGPWDTTARVSGPVTGEEARVAFQATVPDPSAPVPALAEYEALAGPLSLEGVAARQGQAWTLDAEASFPSGIAASVAGPVTGPTPRIEFDATVPQLEAVVPGLDALRALAGRADLTGLLTQRGGEWVVDARVDAPAGITARARGPLTGQEAPALDVAATIPDLSALPGGLEGLLSLDGTIRQTPAGLAIEARANGPADAVATVETVLDDSLSVDFTLDAPRLSAFVPGLPGGADISGTARQEEGGFVIDLAGTGPYAARLDAQVDLRDGLVVQATGQIPDASAITAQLRGPIDFDVAVDQDGEAFVVDAEANGAQGLSISVEGPATGPNADLAIEARAANVAALAPGLSGALTADGRLFREGEAYAFDLSASGPLGGDLTASGTLTGPGAPQARFDLNIPDIGPLIPDLSGPLSANGTVSQAGDGVAVDATLNGPAGTTAQVTGAAGASMDLSITGQAPFGLANALIAPRRIAGVARFDLALQGAPGLDGLSGTITTSGAALSLPTLQNALENIDATVTLGGGQVNVSLTASPATGGTLSVQGPIGLSAPFNANLAANFDIVLEDPSLYTAPVQGNLSITGPLTGGALIAGVVNLGQTDIAVPSTGLTAIGDLPPIRHVNAPRPVRRTLERAGQDEASNGANGGAAAGGPGFGLDITVNAPGRIFIRGRGLDAELGGSLTVQGTTSNPIIAGGFELVRGRLDILQQRFTLDEGSISFQGDLVPFIRLVAITRPEGITASIIVEGPADAIEVRFESSPELPDEEVLARIFFGRDLSQLSPLQALQLANSVATLAGRGSGGLLESLRGNAGLDDLDLTTDADGNTALRAGKYLSDNVYTDVQVDQEGNAEVTLNLDITESLTVRGTTGAAGDTTLGIFFERDY